MQLKLFVCFGLCFPARMLLPVAGYSFFFWPISCRSGSDNWKNDVQCIRILTDIDVSLDGWAGTCLEVKDMRHFLWLYTYIWPFCTKRLAVLVQRNAGKYFRDKLSQLAFRIVAWFKVEGNTVNAVVSPECSKQGQLRSGCSGLCPAEFWLSTKTRVFQPPWHTRSTVWPCLGEKNNFLRCNLCLCLSLLYF